MVRQTRSQGINLGSESDHRMLSISYTSSSSWMHFIHLHLIENCLSSFHCNPDPSFFIMLRIKFDQVSFLYYLREVSLVWSHPSNRPQVLPLPLEAWTGNSRLGILRFFFVRRVTVLARNNTHASPVSAQEDHRENNLTWSKYFGMVRRIFKILRNSRRICLIFEGVDTPPFGSLAEVAPAPV